MLRILIGQKYDGFPEKPINTESLETAYTETGPSSKLSQWALDHFIFNAYKGILSARTDKRARVLEEAMVFEQDVTRALVRFGENGKQAEKYLKVLTHEGERGFEFGSSPQDTQHRGSPGRSMFMMPQRPLDS